MLKIKKYLYILSLSETWWTATLTQDKNAKENCAEEIMRN